LWYGHILICVFPPLRSGSDSLLEVSLHRN
jgi:hypothetical protein